MSPKELPSLLGFLSEELNYNVRPAATVLGYERFFVDLSSWKLQLTSHTPAIWVKSADLSETSPQHLLQSLRDVVRECGHDHKPVLILLDGDSRPILPYTHTPLNNFVLLGAEEQKKIRNSRRPSGELLDLISTQIPISGLAPYETSTPVTGSRFFGRDFEIGQILGRGDTHFIVLGIRRIGKTSLLHETQRILVEREEGETRHIQYLDCSDLLTTEDFIREVVRKLNPRELPRLDLQKYAFYFPDFLQRMARMYRRKIILLLDEVDNLVLLQHGQWELFRMLRSAANTGSCRLVFAGYRDAMQQLYFLDSPFYNFAEELRLDRFSFKEALHLIVTPLENLRIHFQNKEEVVSRIYEETAGHPNLIQYYCMLLLKRLDQTGEREISADSLISVYTDEGFKSHLLTSFMQNTGTREKAIVYAVLKGSEETRLRNFSQAYIDAILRKQGLVMRQDDIEEACNFLVLAGIFQPRKGRDYSFTSPVFVKLLQQTHDIDYLLRKVKEEDYDRTR